MVQTLRQSLPAIGCEAYPEPIGSVGGKGSPPRNVHEACWVTPHRFFSLCKQPLHLGITLGFLAGEPALALHEQTGTGLRSLHNLNTIAGLNVHLHQA